MSLNQFSLLFGEKTSRGIIHLYEQQVFNVSCAGLFSDSVAHYCIFIFLRASEFKHQFNISMMK